MINLNCVHNTLERHRSLRFLIIISTSTPLPTTGRAHIIYFALIEPDAVCDVYMAGSHGEVEGQAAIEGETEVVTEAAHIGPITAISIAWGGRHHARPALALTLLTAWVISLQIDLLLEVLLHLPVTGMPILLDLLTEKTPVFEETSQQPDLHRNGKGLEAHHRVAVVALSLPRVQITPIIGISGIEAPHSRNEVAATKVVVLQGEDHHAGAGTVVEKTVVVQTSHAREGLDHRFMNEGSVLRLIDGLAPLVVTITATTDLTIGRTHSTQSRRNSAMNTNRPTQSVVDDTARPASPPRPIPSFDSDNLGDLGEHRDELPIHAMRSDGNNQSRHRPSRPHLDSRPYADAQNGTTGSYPGSPQPPSPYSSGRGGWSGPPPHASPYRNDDYSSQNGNYYHNQGQFNGPGNNRPQSPYGGPPHRGGHSGGGHRGNFSNQGPDRRFSGSGPHPYHNGPSQRGARSHFNNLQWTASGSRGRGGQHSPHPAHMDGSQTPSRPQSHNEPQSPRAGESEHHHSRPPTRDEEMNQAQPQSAGGNPPSMPPQTHESNETTPANKGGKFSFAFKSKAAPSPAPKPVPDLAQRMLQVREPAPRAPEPPQQPRNRFTNGPLPRFKPDSRADRRDRDRGRNRDRDRRDFREPREFRDPRDRRDDRRFDQRRDRRQGERPPDRPSDWPDRRRDPSPEPPREPSPPKQKRILTRPKPRPTIPAEFANAESVYYRKPGNESVIGAGTYGKVFKGIHVYTQRKVALKKIRMEGEKDGFPVTAVREIKLLQHLRNHNVVSLLEVMVEKNECFMVFEYLSHDLTGLINHPTFSLTLSHKKDLAKQMFEGLNYLHHRGVLHRDIKAANILISNRGLLKFADFGLARFFSKSRQLDYTNRVITIWYRPPELLLGETRYGPAVDVWSAACVCMEMFTKKAVFPGEGGELSQIDKIYNALGTPTKTEWPDLVEMPWFHLMRPTERRKRVFEDVYCDVLTTGAMDLISSIFRYDPSKRPSAEDVLKHPYFVSEEPTPHPPIELEHVEGDWHEFESKALRKEARRVEYQNQKDRDKRKADTSVPSSDRDSKRTKQDSSDRVSAQ
ncbi:hypothetical protein DTO013E5_6018 [Penicillium roqueforti]|nr:hypothetical protein CBS147354_8569 [Penicillium roqueforti]KAI2736998.1 hypothetical protein DTO012A1_7868 [Penicillium roqueforti]KAI2746055.1 hypothetical protein DTO013F2_7063 [Penicillium roqueforti]KAI2770229.1 hypothetical protein DTO012A8_4857 [Penicillium roqueforti]KAI3067242.1 hypothetical protein CBS147339_8508 [Penicillium roqueforti]